MAANWQALTDVLLGKGDRVTMTWSELERLVGGLPASAIRHAAWWTGDRPHTRAWRAAGFELVERRPGIQVVFERRQGSEGDLLLITCVKEKAPEPCAARDLYRSPLFTEMRDYAERSGRQWFILSAEHGLVAPDEWLAPYDRYLPDTSQEYRTAWGEWVVARLELLAGPLRGRTVEIQAREEYVEPLRAPLARRGAQLAVPLADVELGQWSTWYVRQGRA